MKPVNQVVVLFFLLFLSASGISAVPLPASVAPPLAGCPQPSDSLVRARAERAATVMGRHPASAAVYRVTDVDMTASGYIDYTYEDYTDDLYEVYEFQSDIPCNWYFYLSVYTEGDCDRVLVYEVDLNGHETLILESYEEDGYISVNTSSMSGRAKLVVETDGSVCYCDRDTEETGIYIEYACSRSLPRNYVNQTVPGHLVVGGNVGIGYTSPTQRLSVDGNFTGHEHIGAFGLIDMNGRMYDPVTAQFLSPDPYIQSPDSWLNYNCYAYCLHNPLMYTDPDGEFWQFIIGGVIGTVSNLWNNRSYLDCWQAWLGYGLSGAVGGALSAINPTAGGVFTTSANAAMDISLGHMPNPDDWTDVAGYALGKFVQGSSVALAGTLGNVGNGLIKSWTQKVTVEGITQTSLAEGTGTLPEFTVEATQKVSVKPYSLSISSKSSFRKELIQRTGINPSGYDAHHIYPKKYGYIFQSKDYNIDINNPLNGTWWEMHEHRRMAYQYNEEWKQFLFS